MKLAGILNSFNIESVNENIKYSYVLMQNQHRFVPLLSSQVPTINHRPSTISRASWKFLAKRKKWSR